MHRDTDADKMRDANQNADPADGDANGDTNGDTDIHTTNGDSDPIPSDNLLR
jgi:hypothetical protein